MFTEFFSACNWIQTSRSPASKRRTLFLRFKLSFFFFLLGEMKDISQFGFIFTDGEEKERYLPVSVAMDHNNLHYHTALQLYTKRETKAWIILSKR